MIWVTHPTGNTFVRALLGGLGESGIPFQFHTTFGVSEAGRWWRRFPGSVRSEIERRLYDLPPAALVTRPARELGRLVAQKLGWKSWVRHESGRFCVDAVYRDLDRAVAARLRRAPQTETPKTVYAYEDGAFESFLAARERGVARIYELPIAYWETSARLLAEEARRRPDWEPTLQATSDSGEKRTRKTSEIELADAVVCPSRFVLESLPPNVRGLKKCLVAPFGSPPLSKSRRAEESSGPIRFLFAGTLTQRKGLADLFDAVKLLGNGDYELVVMGSLVAPMGFYRGQCPGFVYEPTRPHAEVVKLMTTCDVLVLPSIVEGRALVQQEAMTAGLPLIVTPNTGGEDLIEEGDTGFLVPIRSPEALAGQMRWFINKRSELPRMREAARRKAGELAWREYARRIIGLLSSAP